MVNMKTLRSDVFQLLTFLVALFLLIPPVPSNEGHRYSFFPVGTLAIGVFAIHQLLQVRTGKVTFILALFQLIIFSGFGYIIYDRSQM